MTFILLFSMSSVGGYSINDTENKIYSRITDFSFDIENRPPHNYFDLTTPDIKPNNTYINFEIFGVILNDYSESIEVIYGECSRPVRFYVELENKSLRYIDSTPPTFEPPIGIPPDIQPPEINESTTFNFPSPPCMTDLSFDLQTGVSYFVGNYSFQIDNVNLEEIPKGNYTFEYYFYGVSELNNANTTFIVGSDDIIVKYENLPAIWNNYDNTEIKLDLGLRYILSSLILIPIWKGREKKNP